MNRSFILLLFFVILFLESCKCQNENIHCVNIDINSLHFRNTIDIKELFDSYKIIPLETQSNSLIGEVFDVKLVDDYIVLCDRRLTNSIFIFNRSGKFINEIKHQGNGPGEYVKLHGFDIDFLKKQILVHDYSLKKLIWYDFSGNWIKEKKLEHRAFYFSYNKGLYYFDRRNAILTNDLSEKYNLLVFDDSFKLIDKLSEYKPYISDYGASLSGMCPIQRVDNGKISYLSALDNNILEISGSRVVNKYCIQYNKFLKVDLFEDYNKKHIHPVKVFNDVKASGMAYNLSHVNSSKYLCLNWKEKEVDRNVWIDKENANTFFYGKIANGLNALPIGRLFFIDNTYAYFIIEDLSLVKKEILDTLNLCMDSNPVILQYKIHK